MKKSVSAMKRHANELLDKFSRKFAAFAIHLARKQRDSELGWRANQEQKQRAFELSLTPNELKAYKIAELKGWIWDRYKVEGENDDGFYVVSWRSEFRKPRKMFGSKLLFRYAGFTQDEAARRLVDDVVPELASKPLSYITMRLAIEKGKK